MTHYCRIPVIIVTGVVFILISVSFNTGLKRVTPPARPKISPVLQAEIDAGLPLNHLIRRVWVFFTDKGIRNSNEYRRGRFMAGRPGVGGFPGSGYCDQFTGEYWIA